MPLNDHLSATQINMWLRCPRQYSYRYWEGLKIPPAGAIVQGSCYHRALEANFEQKVETERDLDLGDVLDAFSDSWTKRLEEEEAIDWEDDAPGQLKDEGIRLVSVYHRLVAPTVQPLQVEVEKKGVIEEVPFVGIVDLIKKDGTIVDHKTAGRSWNQDDADKDIQITAYGFLMDAPINCEFHVAVKTKEPKVQVLQTHRSEQDVIWWLDMVMNITKQMQTGIAPPNPVGWHCSPKMCGYWQLCKGR